MRIGISAAPAYGCIDASKIPRPASAEIAETVGAPSIDEEIKFLASKLSS
jgi:hypothetical protein